MPTEIGAPAGPQGGAEGGSPLTRKIGPLPAWGWAVVVAGAVLVARALRGKPATGGESAPGAIPVGAGGDLGSGDTGGDGIAAPPTGPVTVPAGYSSILSQITDWFQQLDRTTRLIGQLRSQIANTNNTARKRRLQAALDKATGKTKIASGKFTYGNATYYQSTWLNSTINSLQAKLGSLSS